MRRIWPQVLVLLMACAVMSGSVGYFLGNRSQGSVYSVQGSITSVPMAVEPPIVESDSVETETLMLNINTATAQELTALPGIGEQKAAAIVAYREANGPFQTPEDLLLVSGIGESTLAGLIDYVTVGD